MKILKWFKWIGGAIIALGVLIFIYYELSGKSKQKAQIDAKIKEIEALETHTEEDKKKLAELQDQATAIEKDIKDANEKAKAALEDLGKKKEEPGDAGKAADDLNKVW